MVKLCFLFNEPVVVDSSQSLPTKLVCTRWIRKLKPGDLRELFQDVKQGRIRVILDPSCPFRFTEEGVRSTMALQKSRHAHGKVVINIADE
jgi:NADPH:quinone reductase-like Zn-dependent oxidoreductase